MSRITLMALVVIMGLGSPLHAQSPAGRADGAAGPLAAPAAFLLANSAVLELTNEQVVRLAEISREATVRRNDLRGRLQAARPGPDGRPDPAVLEQRRSMMSELRASLEDDREAAIAVLTAEQQARAWELLAQSRSQQARRGSAMAAPRDRERPARPDRTFRRQRSGNRAAPAQ